MRVRIVVACAILAAGVLEAQPRARKEAVFYPEAATPPRELPPGYRAGLGGAREVALAALNTAELATLSERSTPLKIGVHRDVPADALRSGSWDSDGLWRLALRSPGASALRVQFQDFSVGQGKVWVHGGGEVAGPYTGRGPFDDGEFWTEAIASDSVTIEYTPDPDAAADDPLPFRIQALAHRVDAAPQAGDTDSADGCHLDPNCFPEWRDSMKMVGQIAFEDSGSEYLCSGALVATRDNNLKPYFLTAGHCVHSEATARTVQAYWTYQTTSCGGPRPARKDSLKSSSGAHLLGSGSIGEGDYSLLLLRDVPGGVWFAGWDPADPPIGTPLVGIHHPAGSYKRISFGRRVEDQLDEVEGSLAPPGDFYQVMWDKGRTEPGSSGSPLFTGPGVIVGMLSYGPVSPDLTACQMNSPVDGYGRFDLAYAALRDYFEDLPGSTVTPAPGSLQFQIKNGTASSQTIALQTQSANPVEFKARADATWVKLSAVTGKVSGSAPAALTVSVDPRILSKPGTFTSTVAVTSGASAPQYLSVRAVVTLTRSNVAVSFNPNPVLEQPPDADGARWFFRIHLDESAGVATQLTILRINGTDYSQSIQNWFGTDRLEANGSLEVALRAGGPSGDQYFEFGGVDEGTRQSWFQPMTLVFAPAAPVSASPNSAR